jgi:hypothetical protein
MARPNLPKDAGLIRSCFYWADRAITHRFDLLGSGLVQVRHNMACAGFEGHVHPPSGIVADRPGRWLKRIRRPNRFESQRLWQLLDPDYIPIDWQLDFKSGFRWDEGEWHGHIQYGSSPGVDVKVPWELARMQHLSQLALASAYADTPEEARRYQMEIRNQILDFMATNPPGFGVNWACAMEVAIRIANWLLAFDIVKSSGLGWDPDFEKILARSVYEHGRHIRRHLEWSRDLRGNHYLANLAGLLFVAAHLPPSPESDAWLQFSSSELSQEFSLQFHSDGSNFEASTAYHRLSAEMVVYSVALLQGLPTPRDKTPQFFNPEQMKRLEKTFDFTRTVTRPDGKITLIGDNDSGRFFKVQPTGTFEKSGELREDSLDCRHLISAGIGFFPSRGNREFARPFSLDGCLVQALAHRQNPEGSNIAQNPPNPNRKDSSWELESYRDFGLYLYRRRDDYFSFRCGNIGQREHGGHAHNDQLSFELAIRGETFLLDPGTYVYTPAWEQRNLFRSTSSHNTLTLEGWEQDPWESGHSGLFALQGRSRARIVQASPEAIEGIHQGFPHVHRRTVNLGLKRIAFEDDCPAPGLKKLFFHCAPDIRPDARKDLALCLFGRHITLRIHPERGIWKIETAFSSPSYGTLVPGVVASLSFTGTEALKWYIDWDHDG